MSLQGKILQNYQLQFDELNRLKTEITEIPDIIEAVKDGENYEKIKRKFEECLFWFYVDGFSSGLLMMGEDKDIPNGYEFLDIRYPDGESVLEKFEKYVKDGDIGKLTNLMDSEAHRMYNTGSLHSVGIETDKETGQPITNSDSTDSTGSTVKSGTNSDSTDSTGSTVKSGTNSNSTGSTARSGIKKTWVTMADEKVRDTHWYLEGETIPLEEEFVTYDGDSAIAPSMFSNPANNTNCRCILWYSK